MQMTQKSMIVKFKISYFHIFKSRHLDQSLAVTGIVRHGLFYYQNLTPQGEFFVLPKKVGLCFEKSKSVALFILVETQA